MAMDLGISLGSMFGILKRLLKGQNSKAGPKVRLLTHDRDRRGIPQVHGGVAPQASVIFGLLFRCQVAISSEEAQADQQGGQEQAGDIHLRRPEWDREGSQVMRQENVPSCFLCFFGLVL